MFMKILNKHLKMTKAILFFPKKTKTNTA